jgi:hypothetical protein
VVTRCLRKNAQDCEVGYDSGLFDHSLTSAETLPDLRFDRQYFGDARDFPAEILVGVNALVHPAAISNDPMGNTFERVTHDVNQTASVRIAELCKTLE